MKLLTISVVELTVPVLNALVYVRALHVCKVTYGMYIHYVDSNYGVHRIIPCSLVRGFGGVYGFCLQDNMELQ